MGKFFLPLRLVALAAAYVIALQALLLPLSVAAGSAFDVSLCTAVASGDGSSPPTGHDTGCPCAAGCGMPCCLQALANPPPVEAALDQRGTVAMTPAPALSPVSRPADRSPQIPRAPPAA
jgi:hypothetical protein